MYEVKKRMKSQLKMGAKSDPESGKPDGVLKSNNPDL